MSDLTFKEYRAGQAIEIARKERRFKVAFITPDFFMELLNACNAREFLLLPETTEVPRGAEVIRIYEDLERQTLGIVICHWSFDEVPQGMVIPCLHDPFIPHVQFRRKSMLDDFSEVKS